MIPGSGRSSGEGNGSPLQYSCLENPLDREVWWATVHGVAKSQTRLSDFTSLGEGGAQNTTHRNVSRYLSRKMQSVISGSYSALDTSGLCWSVLADRVRLKHPNCRPVSYSGEGVAGEGEGREMDGANLPSPI